MEPNEAYAEECKEQADTLMILAVGETGAGKSSLIRLATADDTVIVGSGAASTTKTTSIYRDRNRNVSWIDTKGTDDDECKENNDEILQIAQKGLYDMDVRRMKIVWLVRPNDKATKVLQTQAKFISKFSTESQNIWESVLIIVKQPAAGDLKLHCNGTLEAARRHGAEHNPLFLGYNCLEWAAAKDESMVAMMESSQNIDLTTRVSFGHFYFEREIMDTIHSSLEKIRDIKPFFAIAQCELCCVIGDKRFEASQCHGNVRMIHLPTDRVKRHKDGATTTQYHPDKSYPVAVHSTSSTWGHPDPVYSYQESKKVDRIQTSHFLFIPIDTTVVDVETTTHHKYKCCGADRSSNGCANLCSNCCSKRSERGCMTEYRKSCCNQIQGSSLGCRNKHSCCNKDTTEPNTECTEYCKNCASQYRDTEGCRMQCCKCEQILPFKGGCSHEGKHRWIKIQH